MLSTLAASGLLLLQQAATFPDTIVTKEIVASPSWFQQVAGVASGLMTVALLVLAVVITPAAWNLRNSHKKFSDLLDRVYGDINPIMRHASSIADNVDYITTTVRTDVQQINATIAAANQRLHTAVQQTEERLNDFNALIAVVQQEAEGLFVSTAATARGVRTGAAVFGAHAAREVSAEREVELLDLEELATLDPLHYDEEMARGIDDRTTGAAAPRHFGPRIRPRPGRDDLA